MMDSSSKHQFITLGNSFDSFKYNIMSYLDKLSCNSVFKWDGLKIVEFDEEIYVGNIEEGKVVGSIMFSKKDDRHAKIFLVQVRDKKGNLKPYQMVAINNDIYEHFNFIPRVPTEEEIKVINDIFNKVKNLTYGIKPKKVNLPKKKALVRLNKFDLDNE